MGTLSSTGREGMVLLVLLTVMCGAVGASRSMKPSTSVAHGYVLHHHHAPPHHPHPPPSLPSPPPPPSLSPPPPSLPPPPPSLPPPDLPSPPPPDQVRRRLLVAPPNCTQSSPVGAPFYPYDPSPTPAPYAFGPDDPSPTPAPAPSSGSDYGLPPPVGDNNSTGAHTTRVSAMKFNQCTYTIITCTGNIEGAGTTADVNAEFSNQFGESVLFVNLKSQNRNFNRGATDTFTLVGDCVPNICKLHLSHDDSGPSPGWFVNTVTVSLLYQTHVFNVFEWLAKDEPPYSLSRTISSCPA